MELVAIIATVILLSTFLTLIFSIAAYFVTRGRNLLAKKRKAEQAPANDGDLNRIYFERYTVDPEPEPQASTSTGRTADQWI